MMHTPGPWRVYHRKPYVRVLRDRQGKGDETGSVQICHMAGPENADLWEFNHRRWQADARLIAEAPAMADALEALVMACDLPGDHCEVAQALLAARAILARIKRETT